MVPEWELEKTDKRGVGRESDLLLIHNQLQRSQLKEEQGNRGNKINQTVANVHLHLRSSLFRPQGAAGVTGAFSK